MLISLLGSLSFSLIISRLLGLLYRCSVSDWYATFSVLAGVDPSNPVLFNGTARDIDGVNVWPMLTGANATQPRAVTPTSEAGYGNREITVDRPSPMHRGGFSMRQNSIDPPSVVLGGE